MASDARFYKDQVTTSNETTQLQYPESIEKLNVSTPRHLLYKDKKKDIYSNRLGISYTVNIKKYKQTQHKDTNNHHTNTFNHNEYVRTRRVYYKEYSHLRFSAIRFTQQTTRWNCLAKSIIKHESNTNTDKPLILHTRTSEVPNL